MKKIAKVLFLLFAVTFYVEASACFAALNISVSSADGSGALRFGRITPDLQNAQELRVRITSTDALQYQVFQRLLDPVINEKGESLDSQAIEAATTSGSNSAGTLYMQSAEPLGFGEQLVYTSAPVGVSDQFEIVYAVRPDRLNATGSFSGRIAFTVRPIGGGAQEQVVVNLSLDSTSERSISVEGGTVPDRVRIKGSDRFDQPADFVRIEIADNFGQEVRIYQEVDFLPQNEKAREIGADVLKFSVSGGEGGSIKVRDVTSLDRQRTLIYAGTPTEDAFKLYFIMAPDRVQEQEAGTYLGKLRYVVEAGTDRQEFTIDLECQVEPVFSMDLEFPPEGMAFPNVLPTTPPMDKEIKVTVRTNLHKPYQIVQSVISPMINEKGVEIDKEYFTVKVEVPAGEKGRTRNTAFAPVASGENPIFYSDGEGSPASFKVVYRLQGYPQISAGSYQAPIRYSLNQN